MSPEQEAACLMTDPFDGGEDNVVVFSDRFVVGRKEYQCGVCLGRVEKGSRHRAIRERLDEMVATNRVCVACCEAMALYALTGESDAMDERYDIGYRAGADGGERRG